MRAAVVALIVLGLIVAALTLLAVNEPVSALEGPAAAVQTLAPTPLNPYRVGPHDKAQCPLPGADGPDLTGCPDASQPATPSIGMGDLRRIESLPPQGWP